MPYYTVGYMVGSLSKQSEAYIQFTEGLITDDGRVTNESTEAFLRTYIEELHRYITRVYTVLPRSSG